MVVSSNRRSFLATLRNVALAVGIASPAIASPVIQSSENPDGLPVMMFDHEGQMIIDSTWNFDRNFDVLELTPKYFFEESCWRGALRVWIPLTTPAMISDFAADYGGKELKSSIIYGEAILIKTHTSTDWFMLHANAKTVIARVCGSFVTQQTIDLRSAKF